jgi:hypothetical protein
MECHVSVVLGWTTENERYGNKVYRTYFSGFAETSLVTHRGFG